MIRIYQVAEVGVPPPLTHFPWNIVMGEDMSCLDRGKLTNQAVFLLVLDKVRESNRKEGYAKTGLLHIDLSTEVAKQRASDFSVPDIDPYFFFRNDMNEQIMMPCHKNDHFFLLMFEKRTRKAVYADSNASFFYPDKLVLNIFRQLDTPNGTVEHLVPPSIVLQNDSTSCGIHVIVNCEKLCNNDFGGLGIAIDVRTERKRLKKLLLSKLAPVGDEEIDLDSMMDSDEAKCDNTETQIVEDLESLINTVDMKKEERKPSPVSSESTNGSELMEMTSNEETGKRSHRKKSKLLRGEQKLIRRDGGLFRRRAHFGSEKEIDDNSGKIATLCAEVDELLKVVKDRDYRKLLLRCREILINKGSSENTTSEQGDDSESENGGSDEDNDYTPPRIQHNLKFLSKKRENELLKLSSMHVPIDVLSRRFGLSDDPDTARRDIRRRQKRSHQNKTNRREGLEQLAQRTAFLVKHCDEVQKVDLHGKDIQRIGMQQAICFGIRDFKASMTWVKKIKKICQLVSRHVNIRLSKIGNDRSAEIEQNIRDFKQVIVPFVAALYPPEQIFNVDQTSLDKELVRNRTLTKRGTKKVIRVCQRDADITHSVTLNLCISADGELLDKCFVTLQEPKPPQRFNILVAPYTQLYVTHSKSGKMDNNLAMEWMDKSFLPQVPDDSVLFLDSWPGFGRMMRLPSVNRRKLEIVVFPPRTTSRLQPLDLHYNLQIKSFLKTLEEHVRQHHPTFIIGKRENLLAILNFTYNQMKAPVYKGMNKIGFERLGIINPSGVAYVVPEKHALGPTAVAGKLCTKCKQFAFVRCSWCNIFYCFKCALWHIH